MSKRVRRGLWIAILGALVVAGGPAQAADTARACAKAKRSLEREEGLKRRNDVALERDRKERASCATDHACARYDARIRELERRNVRREARLDKARADVEKACTPS